MKLSRSVKHTIRMGQYESIVLEAGVELDTSTETGSMPVEEFMQIELDTLLKEDLELAEAALEDDSYLPTWNENKKGDQ